MTEDQWMEEVKAAEWWFSSTGLISERSWPSELVFFLHCRSRIKSEIISFKTYKNGGPQDPSPEIWGNSLLKWVLGPLLFPAAQEFLFLDRWTTEEQRSQEKQAHNESVPASARRPELTWIRPICRAVWPHLTLREFWLNHPFKNHHGAETDSFHFLRERSDAWFQKWCACRPDQDLYYMSLHQQKVLFFYQVKGVHITFKWWSRIMALKIISAMRRGLRSQLLARCCAMWNFISFLPQLEIFGKYFPLFFFPKCRSELIRSIDMETTYIQAGAKHLVM